MPTDESSWRLRCERLVNWLVGLIILVAISRSRALPPRGPERASPGDSRVLSRRRAAAPQIGPLWLLVVSLALGLFAFSEDLVEAVSGWEFGDRRIGVAVLASDLLFVAGVAALTSVLATRHSSQLDGRRSRLRRWGPWVGVTSLILALDGIYGLRIAPEVTDGNQRELARLTVVVAYVPTLVWLVALAHGEVERVTPLDQRVMLAAPLAIGVGAAYAAEILWVAGDEQADKEFFAQMSQIVALLLVALVVESRFLAARAGVRDIRWALNVYTVATLIVAEAIVLSALAAWPPDQDAALAGWHEYVAFAGAWYACGVGGTALVVLVAGPVGVESDRRLSQRVRLLATSAAGGEPTDWTVEFFEEAPAQTGSVEPADQVSDSPQLGSQPTPYPPPPSLRGGTRDR